MSDYRTAPADSEKMPAGIPYIIGNEAAERFSFYGMKTILVVFMTTYLMDAAGAEDFMSEAEAKVWFHNFTTAAYFFPILGALLADAFLGKYKTILWLSIVYCMGHAALAIDETRTGLAVGLALIALGSGGIKSCVSAHVGDQFGKKNSHLLDKVFSAFYFSINFGSAASTLLTPVLLKEFGPHIAFGVPGVLMAIATFLFWLGRNKFIHIPAGGVGFVKESLSGEGLQAIGKLAVIYLFISMFWALFDQTGSAWVLQARNMDLTVMGMELLPSQIQAANPILVMLLIPTFTFGLYPLVDKVVKVTPLRKIAVGLFIAVGSFAITAMVEQWITAGERPSVAWHLVAYIIITAAEVMVSITALEFSYTQAPKKMKSLIMGLYLLSVSVGNFFVARVNEFIQNDDGTSMLEGASYYWFFSGCMLVTAVLFIFVAYFYKEKTYIQDSHDAIQARAEGVDER